jgi:hypothetical protein
MYLLQQSLPCAWFGLGRSLTAVITASLVGAAAAWSLVQLNGGLAGLVAAIGASGFVTVGVLSVLDRRLQLNLMRDLAQVFPNIMTAWTDLTGLSRGWLVVARRGGTQ